MTWRLLAALLMATSVVGCAVTGDPQSWTRTGRSNCFGQSRHQAEPGGLVFFCAESP